MIVGWTAATLIAIIYLVFYQNQLDQNLRVSIGALVALEWLSATLVFSAGRRALHEFRNRTKAGSRAPESASEEE